MVVIALFVTLCSCLPTDDNGLPTSSIAAIVICSLLFLAAVVVAFIYRQQLSTHCTALTTWLTTHWSSPQPDPRQRRDSFAKIQSGILPKQSTALLDPNEQAKRIQEIDDINEKMDHNVKLTAEQRSNVEMSGAAAWSIVPVRNSEESFVDYQGEYAIIQGGLEISAMACIPLARDCQYFEIKIVKKSEAGNVAIGVTTNNYPSFRLPGYQKFGIAFHSIDGKLYTNSTLGTDFSTPFTTGDTIGCGFTEKTRIYFTKNGKHLGFAPVNFTFGSIFPAVGSNGPCKLRVNFGEKPFVYGREDD